MAIASTVQLRGYFSGLLAGSRSVSPTDFSNAAAPSHVIQITLASGANTITIPTGTRGVLIAFDITSTATKTLKGITGDTGVILDPVGWNFLRFAASPPTNFVIDSSITDTGKKTEITFF